MRWITATDLEVWSARLDARSQFPGLIADLVRATASRLEAFRFPSGDKGQVRGFDGFMEAEAAPPFVPGGRSIWEFGVSKESLSKLDKDYEKRTSEVTSEPGQYGARIDPSQTTFVFVSPWTWNNPNLKLPEWEEGGRREGVWKDVKVLDGTQIERWLDSCPAVAARWARVELKLAPYLGARSTDEFWSAFANRFSPAVNEEVVLAGRERQSIDLLEAISAGQGIYRLSADSAEEVLAFAVASIRKLEPDKRLFLEARTLIVDRETAAQELTTRTGLKLFPIGEAVSLGGVLQMENMVVIGTSRWL